MATNTAVVGIQWGDEGKGKLVDILAEKHDYVVRYCGGANAGHTVVIDGKRYAFNLLPSGILHTEKKCVLGNGMVIDPVTLLIEIDALPKEHAQIYVSDRAHVVLPKHIITDAEREKTQKIGTTKKGIGPVYEDKSSRQGLRFCDKNWAAHFNINAWNELGKYATTEREKALWDKKKAHFNTDILERVKPFVRDTRVILQQALKAQQPILFEGAQATLLDVDHGTYPYVTSSTNSIGGVYSGTGVRPRELKVIGVAKAYSTRVGEGPFPTEQMNDIGQHLQEKGIEIGTTTGRKRRCGFFDAVVAKYSAEINGCDEISLTKLDVLSGLDELLVCDYYFNTLNDEIIRTMPASIEELIYCEPHYKLLEGWKEDISKARSEEELPKEAQNYVATIEQLLGVPITFVGVGSDRKQIIRRGPNNGLMYF